MGRREREAAEEDERKEDEGGWKGEKVRGNLRDSRRQEGGRCVCGGG